MEHDGIKLDSEHGEYLAFVRCRSGQLGFKPPSLVRGDDSSLSRFQILLTPLETFLSKNIDLAPCLLNFTGDMCVK